MKLQPPVPLLKAFVVAVIVGVIGWIGLDIPRGAIEQSVDEQFAAWESGEVDVTNEGTKLTTAARVIEVIDGDTVIVQIDGQEVTLRFIGIDTPETEHSPAGAECYGTEATARARQLLQDRVILIRADDTQDAKDVHGRLLVYAELPDERDFGEVMIAEGLAREYTYARDYAQQNVYQNAQTDAQKNARGLWAACTTE